MSSTKVIVPVVVISFILSSFFILGVTRIGVSKKNIFQYDTEEDFESTIEQTYTNVSYYRPYPKDLNITRKLLREIVGKKHTTNRGIKYPSVYVRRYGRLGNNILQLSNAIYFSEIMNVSTIYIPMNFAWIRQKVITSKGITIIPTKAKANNSLVLRRVLFKLSKDDYYPEDRIYEFANETLKNVRPIDIDNNALYIHIRSGDIFEENPNPAYGQPPLCFYESIINKWNFSDVYILTEDTKNPVTNILVKKYNAKIVITDLHKTVSYVLYSKNLVLSYGTFLPSLLTLLPEDPEKRIFRYGNKLGCNRVIWKKFFFTDVSEYYENNNMGFLWNNTYDQRQLMLNETCGEKWKVSMYTRYMIDGTD